MLFKPPIESGLPTGETVSDGRIGDAEITEGLKARVRGFSEDC
jgi:hypothetical protein